MKNFRLLPVLFLISLLFSTISFAQETTPFQAIHNSADPEMAFVDVDVVVQTLYGPLVLGELDSVSYLTAFPMEDGPVGIPLTVKINKSNGPEVFDFGISLINSQTYIGMILGVIDPTQFAPNPEGKDIVLSVTKTDSGRKVSTTGGQAQFIFVHGVTDAPAVNLKLSTGDTLVENISYGDLSDYVTLTPAPYVFNLTNAENDTIIASFNTDLSPYADSAFVLFTSGFLNPSANQNGAELGLFGATPGGRTIRFPKIPPTSIVRRTDNRITNYSLLQNYPNPFNPSTHIEFVIPESEEVEVSVFDVTGQKIQTLVNGKLSAGRHILQWNAQNYPSGLYFYQLRTQNFSQVKKLILLR